MRIGFVGLGNMGLPMARNLSKAGHSVVGFDVNTAALEKLKPEVTSAQTVAAAISNAEVIITMLPSGREVRDVYLGTGAVLTTAAPDTLLIDSSTIDIATAREVAAAAAKRGLALLDAPVSGGVAGAQAASLTFMVGGDAPAFERARVILAAMGKTIIHAGASGSGQAAKICNNMILGISMIGVSEAFALAERLGLDHQKLFDISSKSSGQCWSLTSCCPVPGPVPTSPANRGYEAGFTAAMMLKDLKLAQDAANAAGLVTPLGADAAGLYQKFVEQGHAGMDFSGIIRLLRAS